MTIASLNNPRVSSAVEKINNIMQDVINDTINLEEITSNDFYIKLGTYGEQIIKVIKDCFWYVDDIRELYLWLGLEVEWMEQEPYVSEKACISFANLLDQKDGGWTIIDKITTDIVSLNENIRGEE